MTYSDDEKSRMDRRARRNVAIDEAGGTGGFAWWWMWIIALLVIVWFAGWGWGGYGGWFGWSGRSAVAAPIRSNGAPANTNARNNNAQSGNAAAGNGNQDNQNTNSSLNAASNNSAQPETATVPAIVNQNDRQRYLGRNVDLRNVKVQRTERNGALWIGPNNASEVLVVRHTSGNTNAGSNQDIKPGEAVTVHGTVEPVTGIGILEKQWNVAPTDAQRADKQGVYIAAQTVTPIQP